MVNVFKIAEARRLSEVSAAAAAMVKRVNESIEAAARLGVSEAFVSVTYRHLTTLERVFGSEGYSFIVTFDPERTCGPDDILEVRIGW